MSGGQCPQQSQRCVPDPGNTEQHLISEGSHRVVATGLVTCGKCEGGSQSFKNGKLGEWTWDNHNLCPSSDPESRRKAGIGTGEENSVT